MRILRDERFQLRIPTLELEVMPAQVADFCLQPLVLRLELLDLLGEGVDNALLLVRVGRAVECVAAEGIFKEPEESTRPMKVSLVNPPRHRAGQLQGHSSLPSEKKRRGIKRRSSILPANDALISPPSPFFAYVYLIAE
jgi:hypothetical protein